jgi:hypothetical protein
MPQVLDEISSHRHVPLVPALEYAEPKPDGEMSGSGSGGSAMKRQVITSNQHKTVQGSGWSTFILTTGGTTTGAAFLGGAFFGPAGAIGGTVAGIVLGLYLHRSK